MNLPPGPKGLPLFGSLFRFRKERLELLSRARDQYGDVVRFKLGPFPFYVVSHPDHARRILHDRREQYEKTGRASMQTKLLAGKSLLVATGERWNRTRRLMQPAFRPGKVTSYLPIISESAVDLLKDWSKRFQSGGMLDVSEEMMHITYRVVGKVLLGDDLAATADRVSQAMKISLEHLYQRIEGMALPLSLPTPGNIAFKRSRHELHEIVKQVLEKRRAATCPAKDLLGSLTEACDVDASGEFDETWLRDEVVTLMLAGHETTASALTWTWYLLSKHPEIEQQAFEEATKVLNGRIPTADDVDNLPFIRQILDESMRLYPPIWAVERKATEQDVIGGYDIPRGATMIVAIHVMHRHPGYWHEPNRFDPNRFTIEENTRRPEYLYLPFGSGPRMCIGMNLALSEAVIILATLIQHVRFESLSTTNAIAQPGITLRVKDGLPMKLIWRKRFSE